MSNQVEKIEVEKITTPEVQQEQTAQPVAVSDEAVMHEQDVKKVEKRQRVVKIVSQVFIYLFLIVEL